MSEPLTLTFVPIYCRRRHDILGYKLLSYERHEMEHVLCVNSKDLWENLGVFDGFRPVTNPYRGLTTDFDLLFNGSCTFSWLDREYAETNPAWKQVIPACVFYSMQPSRNPKGELDVTLKPHPRFFSYTRMKGQGEARLHGKKSICVGGHINPEDLGSTTHNMQVVKSEEPKLAYFAGLQRELEEEVFIKGSMGRPKLVGLIYDSTTPVGEVHLGMVHLICMHSTDQVEAKDPNMGDPLWLNMEELKAAEPSFEGWGQLLIPHLLGLTNAESEQS